MIEYRALLMECWALLTYLHLFGLDRLPIGGGGRLGVGVFICVYVCGMTHARVTYTRRGWWLARVKCVHICLYV